MGFKHYTAETPADTDIVSMMGDKYPVAPYAGVVGPNMHDLGTHQVLVWLGRGNEENLVIGGIHFNSDGVKIRIERDLGIKLTKVVQEEVSA